MDGGALLIEEDRLTGVETYCRLSRPTPVRDMPAILYDASCSSEGTDYNYRLMIMAKRYGVYLISETGVTVWHLCIARLPCR